MLKISHKNLLDKALAEVETLDLDAARSLLGQDDVVFVDIRDVRELQREGKIPGAFHAPRGMLEFWIDPASGDWLLVEGSTVDLVTGEVSAPLSHFSEYRIGNRFLGKAGW